MLLRCEYCDYTIIIISFASESVIFWFFFILRAATLAQKKASSKSESIYIKSVHHEYVIIIIITLIRVERNQLLHKLTSSANGFISNTCLVVTSARRYTQIHIRKFAPTFTYSQRSIIYKHIYNIYLFIEFFVFCSCIYFLHVRRLLLLLLLTMRKCNGQSLRVPQATANNSAKNIRFGLINVFLFICTGLISAFRESDMISISRLIYYYHMVARGQGDRPEHI